MKRKPQDFSAPADPSLPIKQQLLLRRMTVTALARKLGRSRKATSGAIHRPQRYPRVRTQIEEVLRD